ncbi:MAG: GNAT family N-acetyltransferase [Bacteroidetes bacterium 4572_77]|nr:MAG: GNAT family N-acetyltransferase [Bacteroidetes bacterium 4572_77]
MIYKIEKAQKTDAESIAQFQIDMAWETENMQLPKETIFNGVEAVFDRPNLGQYFVAKDGDKLLASLLITYEWSDWRNVQVWWIQSVFVQIEYRRKGVFTAFYNHLKDIVVKDKHIGGLRLYVDKTNVSAQKTYKKLGMNGEHYQFFEWMKEY